MLDAAAEQVEEKQKLVYAKQVQDWKIRVVDGHEVGKAAACYINSASTQTFADFPPKPLFLSFLHIHVVSTYSRHVTPRHAMPCRVLLPPP